MLGRKAKKVLVDELAARNVTEIRLPEQGDSVPTRADHRKRRRQGVEAVGDDIGEEDPQNYNLAKRFVEDSHMSVGLETVYY